MKKKCRQIMFRDLENDAIHGGILLDNGDVICGCCGGIQEKDDQGTTWELLKTFDENWKNLDDDILGYEYYNIKDGFKIHACSCRNCSAYEECTARRGSCYRYGGSVDGDNIEADCIHGTDGLLIYGNFEGEDEQVTFLPMETELKPEEAVKYLLELDVTDKTPDGLAKLKASLTEYMVNQGINDFQNVKLRFERDRG